MTTDKVPMIPQPKRKLYFKFPTAGHVSDIYCASKGDKAVFFTCSSTFR